MLLILHGVIKRAKTRFILLANVDLLSTKSILGNSALHFYIESIFVQTGTVQLLLNYGVDPSQRDSTGASALSLYKDLPLIVANPDVQAAGFQQK